MSSRRRTWFLVRVTLYLVVIGFLFIYRGGTSWHRLINHFKPAATPSSHLVISGRDLAPHLVDHLLVAYGQDYPDLDITAKGGGTNQALEDLINGHADVAFLYRQPSAIEQELFRQVTGDTAIVTPVAVGAILVAATGSDETGSLTADQLGEALAGKRPGLKHIYLPDPNEGLWDALRESLNDSLDLGGDTLPAGSPIVFLPKSADVLAAVAVADSLHDNETWGLISSLTLPQGAETPPPPGVQYLPSRASLDSLPAEPSYENVATGAYPLHHILWIACRGAGDPQGGSFLTHMATARGLRQVERAGVVPARSMLREIYLTRKPLGK